MTRRLLAALVVTVTLGSCSTHRQDLAISSGMQSAQVASPPFEMAARALVDHEAAKADTLSAPSLAPLTAAASILAELSPSPQRVSVARRLAGLLTRARIGPHGSFGVTVRAQPPQASPALTAIAGLALLDAYQATGDQADREAAIGAARALTRRELGWRTTSVGAGVTVGPRPANFDIASTADAAWLLLRISRAAVPGYAGVARDAFRVVFDDQAAVGRWYAVREKHQPMSASQWGQTLYALQGSQLSVALGITGAGMPALRAVEFRPSGLPAAADALGAATDATAIAAYPVVDVGAQIFAAVLSARRPDGTISFAREDDDRAQAWFAQALAQQATTLRATQ